LILSPDRRTGEEFLLPDKIYTIADTGNAKIYTSILTSKG